MIYLFLAVCCSASIGIVFKISEQRAANRYLITTINYLTAVVFSGFMLAQSGIGGFPADLNLSRFVTQLMQFDHVSSTKLPMMESYLGAVLLGVVTGWFYFISFIWYQISVNRNGISLSGMFSRMGILLPMAVSIILWHEIPNTFQVAGIALCLFAIVLVNSNFRKGERFEINGSLVLLFLYFGLAIFCNKVFQKYIFLELKPLFLFSVFLSAGVFSLTRSLRFLRMVTRVEIVVGISVGIPNLLTAWFLIQALDELKASVVFPVFSAGTIIMMALEAVALFKEKLKTRAAIAILMTAFALVLINL